jgi:hypothetical protein
VVRQSPRCTPCFVVNWLTADVSLWPFCVHRMYLTVRWPLLDMQSVIINICRVRVVMRNIVPGSIMTAVWWYCQLNQVSLPEFVEECFARLQFVYFILCWRPWNVAADTRNTSNFGCFSLTIRLVCLLLQLQVFGILHLCGSLAVAPMKNSHSFFLRWCLKYAFRKYLDLNVTAVVRCVP